MKQRKLSILAHPRVFWEGRINGVARYVCELSQALINLGLDIHIPIKETPNEYLLKASYFPKTSGETPRLPIWIRVIAFFGEKSKKAQQFINVKRRWEGVAFLEKGKFDLIHPTHNNSLEILEHRNGKALVVTVHDMIHELFPTSFPAWDPSAERKKIMCEAANRIIAISQCTKDDLIRICQIDSDKIDVIHHGNSLLLPPNPEEHRICKDEPYILFVGQRMGYKNFMRCLRVYGKLAKLHPEMHFVCAGGGAFTDQEIKLINEQELQDKISQQWVSDEELALLYQGSVAFIYPSQYEGFGLPILEAFACEAPVLCAKASCFPEVAGEAALYFDPVSEDEMLQALCSFCQSEELREEYIAKGKSRIKDFSWRKCAEETLQCYQKALKLNQNK